MSALKIFSQAKFRLLEKLKHGNEQKFIPPNTLKTNTITVKFYGKNEMPKARLDNTLPVLLHSCPEDFSTIDYFNVSDFRTEEHLIFL